MISNPPPFWRHRPLRWLTRVLFLGIILASRQASAQPPAPPNAATPVTTPTARLLAFHTPDKDFQPVEPADWVLDGAVKAFLPPATDVEDIEKRIDAAAALGVTVIHTGGFWPYWPLVKDDPHSGLSEKERAALRRTVACAKKHGMRVIYGVSPFAPVAVVRAHPEWLPSPADDDAIRQKALAADLTQFDNQALRALGLDSPWGPMAIEGLAEVMKEYGLDGYSFDGHYHPAINFAPYAKEAFTRETGRPFPTKADLNDVGYRVYLIWADDRLEDWYRRLRERLREVNPQAAIYTWTTNAGRYGHFLTSPRVMSTRMNRLFDAPIQEWWLDEVNLGSSIVPAFGAAYVRAVQGGRIGACEPYVISHGNPYSADSFPAHEVLTRSLMAMTNGAFTPLAGANGTTQTLAEIRRRAPFITRTRQLPWAALLVSEQTRQFYAYRDVMGLWLAHALGVYRTAAEEHLPLTLINDWDVTAEGLAPFKVLILPNTACLSDAQVTAIKDFVARGGGLVASCETSLYDEIGRPRAGFALGELFGVDYQGRPQAPSLRPALDANFAIVVDEKYWAQRLNAGWLRWQGSDCPAPELTADPHLHTIDADAQASYKGALVKVSEPRPPMKRALFFFPESGQTAPIPAAVMGEQGPGRVVYLAAGLDSAMYSYGFPYERVLLAQAIRWAAREPFPVTVKAPMCIQATYFEQPAAPAHPQRLVLHLFNNINSTAGHGLPEVEVPLREEAVPVSGIQVAFGGDYGAKIRRVRLEPDGFELTARPGSDGTPTVELPPLAIHAMVVADLE